MVNHLHSYSPTLLEGGRLQPTCLIERRRRLGKQAAGVVAPSPLDQPDAAREYVSGPGATTPID